MPCARQGGVNQAGNRRTEDRTVSATPSNGSEEHNSELWTSGHSERVSGHFERALAAVGRRFRGWLGSSCQFEHFVVRRQALPISSSIQRLWGMAKVPTCRKQLSKAKASPGEAHMRRQNTKRKLNSKHILY